MSHTVDPGTEKRHVNAVRAQVITTNTIFYCKRWEATVRFYRDRLKLPVHFSADWFVEFELTTVSRLSIADEKRATISGGVF